MITAYHAVFEAKLKKLIHHIKDIRKNKGSKDELKRVLHEAKQLKNILKEGKPKKTHTITVHYDPAIDSNPAITINSNVLEFVKVIKEDDTLFHIELKLISKE